jgi:hypothetical protein
MYHTIEFLTDFAADLEVSPKHRLEQTLLCKGDRLPAQIKPSVVETEEGFVEAADLFLADGTVVRTVPFEHFAFVE